MRMVRGWLLGVLALTPFLFAGSPLRPLPAPVGQVEVLSRVGSTISRLTDGDTVSLRVTLPDKVDKSEPIDLVLDEDLHPVASCTIPSGESTCETSALAALGWYWRPGGIPSPQRILRARVSGDILDLAQTALADAPRPVVMVHGFSSSWEAWVTYLGPTGFLEPIGLSGFAVGDGQVPGTMNTGNLAEPTRRTNTLDENAAIVGEYIEGVKQATGAQSVDLIAHSMGGLIARAYIDRVMTQRDVAQLIMLGSPMAGTDCADLPASLGLYLPATLELRPSYVRQIFNPQVSHRHGVAFHALAGVPILEGFKSPCTDVPTDLAVSLQSVTAIAVQARQLPVLHMNLNLSQQVFDEFVQPLLQTPAGAFSDEPDPATPVQDAGAMQFSRVFTGHVDAGSSAEMTIPIDPGISVASFALYDTTRSLQVTVTGASGKTIELSAAKNGLVVVQDPQSMFYLGYGFQDPKPGAWRVHLSASDTTPAQGADFALTARFVGGAQLESNLSTLLPRTGQEVGLTASLRLGDANLPLRAAEALVRLPDGTTERVTLAIRESVSQASLRPRLPGLYGIDITVTGVAADGTAIERSAFLAFEAQPEAAPGLPPSIWIGAALGLILVSGLAARSIRRRRRNESSSI